MLLSEARTRLAKLVDDVEADKFDSTEIDDALTSAQLEVWQHAIAHGGASIFTVEASVTTSSAGVADLTTLKPIRLVNVAVYASGSRLAVSPARLDEQPTNYSGAQTLKVAYVPRVTFPSSASTAFTWAHANITAVQLFESLMLFTAASDLLIKEGVSNAALDKRKAELREAVKSTLSIPGWTVLPLGDAMRRRRDSGIRYIMTSPDTLQLVYV